MLLQAPSVTVAGAWAAWYAAAAVAVCDPMQQQQLKVQQKQSVNGSDRRYSRVERKQHMQVIGGSMYK